MKENLIETLIEKEVRAYVYSNNHEVKQVIVHNFYPKLNDIHLDSGDTLFISAKGNVDIIYDNHNYQEVRIHEYAINRMEVRYNNITHQFERLDSIIERIIILDYPPKAPIKVGTLGIK